MATRVKNLKGTSGCTHYKVVAVKKEYSSIVGCSVNLCVNKGKAECKQNQCHVIKENQNATTGIRYLVPMCTSHNQTYGQVLEVDGRLEDLQIPNCKCGNL
jgi:hypothetical protein